MSILTSTNKKNPGASLWSEVDLGRAYRNEKHTKEPSPITPRHSPLNLPFNLCRMFRNTKAKRKFCRRKKSKNQSHKISLLDRSALCQNDYMNLLSIPNKSNQTRQTKKKTCFKCKVEPCSPRLVQMSIPNKRLVLENWKTYQSTLSPEILVRFDKILKSGDNLELRDARYYFKKLQKQKRKENKKKKQICKANKKRKIKGSKQWIKKEINNLAQMIAEFIENQPLLTLNFQQMITSNKLLEYLNKEKIVKFNGRNTKSTFKKTVIEINDKIVNWLDTINYQAEMQPLSSKDKISTLLDIPSLEGLLREAEETDEESKIIWSEDEESVASDEEKYEKTSGKKESLLGEDEDVQFIAKKIMDHSKLFDENEPEEYILQMFPDLDEDTLDKLINILSTSSSEFLNQFVDNDSIPGVTYQDILLKLEEIRENKILEKPGTFLLEDIIVEWAKNNKPDEIDDKILDKIRETSTILAEVFKNIDQSKIHKKSSNSEEKIDEPQPVDEKTFKSSSLNEAPTFILENETEAEKNKQDEESEQINKSEQQEKKEHEEEDEKQEEEKEEKHEEEKKEEHEEEKEDEKEKENGEHKEEEEDREHEEEAEEEHKEEEENGDHEKDAEEVGENRDLREENEEHEVKHAKDNKKYGKDDEEQETENRSLAINQEIKNDANNEINSKVQIKENEEKDEKISNEEIEKLSRKDSLTDNFKNKDFTKEPSEKNLDTIEESKIKPIEVDIKIEKSKKRESTVKKIKQDPIEDLQASIEKPAKQLSDLLQVIKGHKPLVVAEHSPGTICCLSLKIWAVWLLEISENAHKWTKWVRDIIKVVRHYSRIIKDEITISNEQKKVLYNEEWRMFIKNTEETMVAWRQYCSHVNDLSVEIIEHFHGKKVNCCPKCLQDHLIKNVPNAHETLKALTEAINCASYWQRCLDKIVNKTLKLAEADVSASIEKMSSASSEQSAIVEIEAAYNSGTIQSDKSDESVAEIIELSIQKPTQFPEYLIEELRLPKINSKLFNIVEFNPELRRQQTAIQPIEEICSKTQFKHICTENKIKA